MELAQLGRIAGDRSAFTRRNLIEHDQANGDTCPCSAKHLLQANIEEQRRFVVCLGESGSIEAVGHDGDDPCTTCGGPDCAA
ncbi:MAG TPA: hypothetical protein DHU71_08035 [Erythrobacter sp.]|nr:hypothetical protein [Erythrobacter sp.]